MIATQVYTDDSYDKSSTQLTINLRVKDSSKTSTDKIGHVDDRIGIFCYLPINKNEALIPGSNDQDHVQSDFYPDAVIVDSINISRKALKKQPPALSCYRS